MRRLVLLVTFCLAGALQAQPPPISAEPAHPNSVVRVNVTNQAWDFFRPWGKSPPYSRRAVGAVLPNNRVLVTAELVANANYVEFETPEGGQKTPATVEAVDYEANLALLKTDDTKFLAPFKPLELASAALGDTLTVLQLEPSGALLLTRGTMTNAEVAPYPMDDSSFLLYHLVTSLQFREAAFTLPVVKGDKLAGLVMRYDQQSTDSDIVPAPIIQHFLEDVAHPPYKGFPRAGVGYAGMRDAQLRHYAGLPDDISGGVYTTDLQKDGPCAQAGIQIGDIILRIDGEAIDQDGSYHDPVYGRISAGHLLSTRHFDGDEIKFTIFRKGETKDVTVRLAHRSLDQYAIEPYTIDRAPKFYILGGLVLEELSRQYLKEWGQDWVKKAPEDLVYLDRHQSELLSDPRQKVVFLSRVLPSDATVGYEEIHHLIISKINGVEIRSLADVPPALVKATGGVHKIEFTTEPGVIYLDAGEVTSSEAALAKAYQLPILRRLD